MPKGVGRPQNRKVKQAVSRQKQRSSLAGRAFSAGASPQTVKQRLSTTAGAKADTKTIAKSKVRGMVRRVMQESGRKTLSQPPSSTKRERIKRKKK